MRRGIVVAVAFSVVGSVCFMAGVMWTGGLAVQAESGGRGAAEPINGDVNGDGKLDVSDGIYIINYVFQGGPLPVPITCPPRALPATGQTKCYNNNFESSEIPCDNADFPGQDGFYQAGCPTEGRFVDNGDETVTDTCTGLMWQKGTADVDGSSSIGSEDSVTWQAALHYCEGLSFADHDDWRLPNVREFQSIMDYGRVQPAIDPVFDAESAWYWSSSTVSSSPDRAMSVFSYVGLIVGYTKGNAYLIRAVRGGM